jgi:glycerate dehydrogenase
MINDKAVFLDAGSMGEDLSLRPLAAVLPQLTLYPGTAAGEVAQRISDARIILVNKVKLGRAEFEAAKQLQLIVLAATGSDNIDIRAASDQGITVCNVTGYSIHSVPQHALTLMLMLATRISQYAADVRQGKWTDAAHFAMLNHPICELKGKNLVIVGYGSLGRQLEKLVAPFGMNVYLCNIPGRPKQPGRIEFDDALSRADFLSLHCPLSPDTNKMMSRQQFQRMKPTACLINTARGQLVDEQALAQALKTAEIAGAGIDVLSQEPPPADHPLLDPGIPNLILTPHNAWGSLESRQQLLEGMINNINCFLQGRAVNVIRPVSI